MPTKNNVKTENHNNNNISSNYVYFCEFCPRHRAFFLLLSMTSTHWIVKQNVWTKNCSKSKRWRECKREKKIPKYLPFLNKFSILFPPLSPLWFNLNFWMCAFIFILFLFLAFTPSLYLNERKKKLNDDLKFLSRDMLQTENGKKNFWFSFRLLFSLSLSQSFFQNKRAQLQLNWKFNMYLITSVT